tara:strand:+ start:1603 stop:3321 length:1719 start_codon:yes stop_codon:yes gene_type:complete
MKRFIKKIYLISLIIISFSYYTESLSKESKISYSSDSISNYFSGIISAKNNNSSNAFKHLKKIQHLKESHSNYNIQFLRTLVLLKKFDQAYNFLKSLKSKEHLFFEADLILGLHYFNNKDFTEARKHFSKLNKMRGDVIGFQDLFGNILMAWTKAAEYKKDDSFELINKIPNRYLHLKKIQNSFLHCYFDTAETQTTFTELIDNKDYDFSRYNFFLINYLISKNKNLDAKKIILESRKKHDTNLLLKETENFFINKKENKITDFFNCKNAKNPIAEFFYIIANLYSHEENYEKSNFYLNIALFLNSHFLPNKALMAENLYYQKKYIPSKNLYISIKSIGPAYSWFSSKNIAAIFLQTKSKEESVSSLKKDFNSIKNPSFFHYYELANFYKDNEYFKDSIKYYSLALKNINLDHHLVPKILDRRGTSYERIGEWEKAEKDLTNSLEILPDEPYVLNYLAYSWIEKRINLEKSLEMLKRATNLKKNDGYIIDSLGWGYYVTKDYVQAAKFLQLAVKLKPQDPIINDHYADALWMLNKNIQARYVWKYVLTLDGVEKKLIKSVNHKLTFGINNKL